MARRTFNDIDAEVLLRLANRNDVTSGQRGFFIRDSYLNIAMMFRHVQLEKNTNLGAGDETLASASDTLTPSLNTDIWFPTMVKNMTDGYVILSESKERVERLITKPTAPPYRFYWFGGRFIFEAKANTAKSIRIWYKRKPTEFSGTSNSELDEMFDPFIIMDAVRIGYETVRDFDNAAVQRKLFMDEALRKKLPVDEAKLNDYRQGFRLRFQ